MFKLIWFSDRKKFWNGRNMWYTNQFKTKEKMEQRIEYFKRQNIEYKIIEKIEEKENA